MTTDDRLKVHADDENEIHDVLAFQDAGACRVTPVARFAPEVAEVIIRTLQGVVRDAHDREDARTPDADGIVRAQRFEEGDVYMLEKPFDGFFADRYLMDFYDVTDRGICSRMHFHTGLRFVRMMTGPGTVIRVSSLTPLQVAPAAAGFGAALHSFVDLLPDVPGDAEVDRHNVIVGENSWVDMQIPRGTSHQFNALGPLAVIDSVHPEESIETFREQMSGYKMMAQTIFLAEDLPDAASCARIPGDGGADD